MKYLKKFEGYITDKKNKYNDCDCENPEIRYFTHDVAFCAKCDGWVDKSRFPKVSKWKQFWRNVAQRYDI